MHRTTPTCAVWAVTWHSGPVPLRDTGPSLRTAYPRQPDPLRWKCSSNTLVFRGPFFRGSFSGSVKPCTSVNTHRLPQEAPPRPLGQPAVFPTSVSGRPVRSTSRDRTYSLLTTIRPRKVRFAHWGTERREPGALCLGSPQETDRPTAPRLPSREACEVTPCFHRTRVSPSGRPSTR